MLSYPDTELLVKIILSSMPTHFLTIYKLPKWAARDIDQYRTMERRKTLTSYVGDIVLLNGNSVSGPRNGRAR
jgi:hypothetical protein